MLDAADVADFGEPDTDVAHVTDDWDVPGFVRERDSVLVEGPHGPAAYGHVLVRAGVRTAEAWGVVHPRDRGRGVGRWLAGSLELRGLRRLAGVAGAGLRTFAPEADRVARALFLGMGYEVVRRFVHMERELGAESSTGAPAGIRIGNLDTGMEEAAWRATEEGFADHWGYEPTPFDVWSAEWLREPSRPELFLVATAGREIAGALLLEEMGQEAWVDELVVRPGFRRRGIGTALLRRAFADLSGRGFHRVRLNVDAESGTGALELYERVGMRERRAWLVYGRAVAG